MASKKRDTFALYLVGRYFGVAGFIGFFLWRLWQSRKKAA